MQIFRGVIHQPEVVLEAWAMYGRAVAYAAELGLTANEAKDLPIRVLERELKEFPIKVDDERAIKAVSILYQSRSPRSAWMRCGLVAHNTCELVVTSGNWSSGTWP